MEAPCRDPEDPSRFDLDEYVKRSLLGPCFVCAIQEGHPEYPAVVIFEDDRHLVFLNRWPTLLGYTLVAPKRHVEDFTVDLTEADYLDLQRLVFRTSRAVASVVPTERMYVMSLGSKQGNAHLHWHIAPLPPGVPYERQQFHAVMAEHGTVDMSSEQETRLATQIAAALGDPAI